jgi:hypothetical protein
MKKIFSVLTGGLCLVFLPLMATWLMMGSCANIIPPGGGLRDTLPPKLVLANPKDSSVNVKPTFITLTFDEYVSAQDVPQNLIVNPSMEIAPLVDYKLRNVTIKIKDTLRENTTYTFQFGESIRDVNESNILRDFTYTFSTGKKLDNLTYSGKVLLAENGKIDSTLIVVLHKNLTDTAIFKLKPPYYTKLNGKGEFSFRFLPSDTFQVFVVKSTFSKKYDDSTQYFAFLPYPIIPGKAKRDTLYAYKALEPVAKPLSVSAAKPGAAAKDDKRLRYTTNLESGKQDLLQPFQLRFQKKISRLDTSGITLCDTLFKPQKGVVVSIDTAGKIISLNYSVKENQAYRLIIAKDAITDSSGATMLKGDTLKFSAKKEEDYASVRLRFVNLDLSKKPVLLLYQSDKMIGSFPLSSTEWRKPLFYSGNFEMRILYDTNGNGIWDPGQYPGNKKLPEVVYLISKELSIKANWDNEVIVEL